MAANQFQPAGWTNRQLFWVFFDDQGNIVTHEVGGGKVIGVSSDKYKQVEEGLQAAVVKAEECHAKAEENQAKADGYYKMLVDAGVIKRELTSDEKIEALANQVGELAKLVGQQAQILTAFQKMQGAAPSEAQKQAVEPEVIPPQPEAEKGDDHGFIANSIARKSFLAQKQPVA